MPSSFVSPLWLPGTEEGSKAQVYHLVVPVREYLQRPIWRFKMLEASVFHKAGHLKEHHTCGTDFVFTLRLMLHTKTNFSQQFYPRGTLEIIFRS